MSHSDTVRPITATVVGPLQPCTQEKLIFSIYPAGIERKGSCTFLTVQRNPQVRGALSSCQSREDKVSWSWWCPWFLIMLRHGLCHGLDAKAQRLSGRISVQSTNMMVWVPWHSTYLLEGVAVSRTCTRTSDIPQVPHSTLDIMVQGIWPYGSFQKEFINTGLSRIAKQNENKLERKWAQIHLHFCFFSCCICDIDNSSFCVCVDWGRRESVLLF